ncbi:MAG: hypothetical protein QXL94_09225 [Candidatus Parvarchaeum sp.]
MAKKWIQKAIKKPNRVRDYLKKQFGDKAFTDRGTIRNEYLKKALEIAENPALKDAIRLAMRLRHFDPDDSKDVDVVYDDKKLPKPDDYSIHPSDVIVRCVPKIDNLVEIGLYLPSEQFDRLKAEFEKLGIKYEIVKSGYLARRGKQNPALNVFFIRD